MLSCVGGSVFATVHLFNFDLGAERSVRHRMKMFQFTEQQIALILQQVDAGLGFDEVCRKESTLPRSHKQAACVAEEEESVCRQPNSEIVSTLPVLSIRPEISCI